MSDKIGLFAGSFDPITKGHLDIIERAAKVVDKFYIGLFYNKEKTGMFSVEERKLMILEATRHLENVAVITSRQQLTVDIAKKYGVTVLVRGLRNAVDLDYEANMAYFNHQLAPEIESLFLLSKPEYQHFSSTRIRELIYFNSDIRPYVPQSVVKIVEKKFETDKKI